MLNSYYYKVCVDIIDTHIKKVYNENVIAKFIDFQQVCKSLDLHDCKSV